MKIVKRNLTTYLTSILLLILGLQFSGLNALGQEEADPFAGDPALNFESEAPTPSDSTGEANTASASGAVTAVDFKFEEPKSKLEITFDQAVNFEKSSSDADKQVVIDVPNARIADRFTRKLDTSSFKSNVSIISPYQSENGVRVVLQLKENAPVEVTQDGNKIVAFIENGNDQVTSTAETKSEPKLPLNSDFVNSNSQQSSESGLENKDSLESFFQAQETKNYVGRRISLQLRDADVHDVFRIISEASDFNIVLGDEVKGRITINLSDVPWDQALDIILHSQRLAAERSGNVLRVTTIDALTKEKQAEAAAQRAAEAAEPLVVKIFPISYAKVDDMKKIIEDFLSREALTEIGQGPTGTGQTSSITLPPRRGSVQIETRTNSLVVRDTPTTIEKIKRILKELDTQTPQVLIEAKFVEIREASSKALQGRIFASSREYDATSNSMLFRSTNNNFGTVFAGSQFGAETLPTSFSVTPVAGASFGFSPRAGLLPGISEISALLSILETEENAKIIASPRIVTQNKEPAEISQGTTIQLPTPTGANAAGGYITVNAVLKLTVVPQVTNDGNITLKVGFSQDTVSAQQLSTDKLTTDTKKVETTVLVDSGATLVIGGVYSSTVLESEGGIPILRDLPLIGPLFGSKASKVDKGELFIFLTPRLLNEKESGLKG